MKCHSFPAGRCSRGGETAVTEARQPSGSEEAGGVADLSGALLCPASGTAGRKLGLVTVKALLTAEALKRLDGRSYLYCPASDCEVVYFDNSAGSRFQKKDLVVRVGQKEESDPIPLCYCFAYTLEDLRRQIERLGKTDIPERIAAEVRAGHCACEVKNPQGSCCLGDVTKRIKQIQAELVTPSR